LDEIRVACFVTVGANEEFPNEMAREQEAVVIELFANKSSIPRVNTVRMYKLVG
jgi:hypothetical protein